MLGQAASAAVEYNPQLAFRGKRDYIHSTDLYPAILAGCAALGLPKPRGSILINIRQRLTTQPRIFYCRGKIHRDRLSDAVADFVLGGAEQGLAGWIAAGGHPVTERKPYDEGAIWSKAHIDNNRISLVGETDANAVEVITALAVLLHNTVCSPPPHQKWLLARLQLLRPLEPRDAAAVALVLRQKLGNLATRTAVESDGAPLGAMNFILSVT